MPTALLCDADVVIVLAQHPQNIEAISAIRRSVENRKFTLIVPQAVKDAFDREKERAAKSYWQSQRTMLRNLRNLENFADDPAQFEAILAQISAKLQAHESETPKTITAVEQLLAAGTPVPTTSEMLAEAAARCQKAQVPAAHFRKSSINDCVIWQVLMAELRKHDHLIFCTNNYSDFSDPKHQLELHPELRAEINGYHSKMCYHNLEGFREKHLTTVEKVITLNRLAGQPYQDCPACGSPLDGGLTAHPSQIGSGWSFYQFCRKCGTRIDTGIPADD